VEVKESSEPDWQLAAENGSREITKNSQLCFSNNGRYLASRLRFPEARSGSYSVSEFNSVSLTVTVS